MLEFIDGPAKGQTIACRRAPILLRVVAKVRDRAQASRQPTLFPIDPPAYQMLSPQTWDALDQPGDTAAAGELIFLYRLTEKPTSMHLCIRGKGKSAAGWYQNGRYRFVTDQPDDATLRDNTSFAVFCEANRDRFLPAWASA